MAYYVHISYLGRCYYPCLLLLNEKEYYKLKYVNFLHEIIFGALAKYPLIVYPWQSLQKRCLKLDYWVIVSSVMKETNWKTILYL